MHSNKHQIVRAGLSWPIAVAGLGNDRRCSVRHTSAVLRSDFTEDLARLQNCVTSNLLRAFMSSDRYERSIHAARIDCPYRLSGVDRRASPIEGPYSRAR